MMYLSIHPWVDFPKKTLLLNISTLRSAASGEPAWELPRSALRGVRGFTNSQKKCGQQAWWVETSYFPVKGNARYKCLDTLLPLTEQHPHHRGLSGFPAVSGAPLLGNKHREKVQVGPRRGGGGGGSFSTCNLLVKRQGKRSLLFQSAGCLGFFFTTYHCEQQPLYLQKTKELTLPQQTMCCRGFFFFALEI